MDQSKTKNDPYPPPSCRNNYVVKADLCYDDLLIPCIHLAPQIWMMLLHIPARLTLLVPLAVLTRKDDFYECAMIVLRRLPQREGLDNNIAAEVGRRGGGGGSSVCDITIIFSASPPTHLIFRSLQLLVNPV